MKKIYSSQDSLLVNHLRNLLETNGIESIVKNDMLYGAAGELPINECWPEVWIENAAQSTQAEALIKEALEEGKSPHPAWKCPECGEEIEGQFAQCWHCGAIP